MGWASQTYEERRKCKTPLAGHQKHTRREDYVGPHGLGIRNKGREENVRPHGLGIRNIRREENVRPHWLGVRNIRGEKKM